MPARTKLQRSGKLAGLRRVYVSWLEPREKRREWIEAFWHRLKLATDQKDEFFEAAMQTGDADPGEILGQWLDPARKKNPITDVVGVLTDTYLESNTDARGVAAQGELARFFDRVLADKDDRLRIYLAPVDPPNWSYRVRKVELGDPGRKWLERLKVGKKGRFTWPYEGEATSMEEIAGAVADIVDKPNKR